MAKKEKDLSESLLDPQQFLNVKVSKQASQEILDSITEASLREFNAVGIDATTNKIAQVAGVSIGSVYRYFLSKEMILKFVILVILNRNRKIFTQQLSDPSYKNLEEAIEKMVDVLFDVFLSKQRFFAIFFEQLHQLKLTEMVHYNRKKLAEELAEVLMNHPHFKVNPENLSDRLFLVISTYVHMLEFYLHSSSRPSREDFRSGIVKMIKTGLVGV